MEDIFKATVEISKKENISTIVVASTTGKTAIGLLQAVAGERLRIIVVTHDDGCSPSARRFSEDARQRLQDNNVLVYTHNRKAAALHGVTEKVLGALGFLTPQKRLKLMEREHGQGIKVCHIIVKMLVEGRILQQGRVVAIAGTAKGADSSGIFCIKSRTGWPFLERIIIKDRKSF